MVEVEKGFLEVAFRSMSEEQRAEIKQVLLGNKNKEYEPYNNDRGREIEGSEVECI